MVAVRPPARPPRAAAGPRGCGGFTYLGLMFLVALLGMTAAAASTLWSVEDQRLRERELLFIGRQFQQALQDYRTLPLPPPEAGAAAGGPPSDRPGSLDDLLRDPRVPYVRRHLRRLYVDPFTGRAEWGVVRDAQQRIVAVYSLSTRRPLRRANLGAASVPDDARSYRDWVFRVQDEQPTP